MTYFGVLALFILPPLAVLAGLVWRTLRWRVLGPYLVIGALVTIALIYTTPWDNYLVATGVWWYDPALVTGITLGWVPLEEYTFFILQTLLTGFWTVWLHLRVFSPSNSWGPLKVPSHALTQRPWRAWVALGGGGVWLGAVVLWRSNWQPVTYTALILVWAIPPILVQLLFGADILWANRHQMAVTLAPSTLYLWLVDFLAIRSGTWTLDPAQTLGLALGGILAIEEMLFFFVTNVLIVFGIHLILSEVSHERARGWMRASPRPGLKPQG